jgi:signal transduction histidine kinase
MQGLAKAPLRIKKFVPHRDEESGDRVSAKAGLAMPSLKPESFDQLAHDARNVLSALKLYCDLLAEPGVLTEKHGHYAQELQAISETAVRLVEGLSLPRRAEASGQSPQEPAEISARGVVQNGERPELFDKAYTGDGEGIADLGHAILEMRPLLVAIAGPHLQVEIETLPCAGRCPLSGEDLIRVLLNLVTNASDAMPDGGRLRITAQYGGGFSFLEPERTPDAQPRSVVIAVEDNGPGIPDAWRERVFSSGFTTRETRRGWPAVQHRGMGLSIVRGLVEAAGGRVQISSRSGLGARFELELPVTYGMYEITHTSGMSADSGAKGCIECQ